MMDTIGFLGCGNMGGAIARAVCKAVDPKKVFLANRTAAKAQALAKELGCKTATNAEVAGDCDLIFLAVKPQMMEALLQPLKFTFDERPSRFVLCSMAAGLSIARIQEMAGEDFPVIRIMPNTPASVGEGMIQYCSSNVTAEEEEAFLRIMAPAGRLDAVPESLIDAASCVSGCGPAWVYQFIEALADGGVKEGLTRDVAYELAIQTVLGSAKLLKDTGMHPGQLKDMVTSPAGTTIEVYATTLHYAPCNVAASGFKCVVVLPKGTNTDITLEEKHTPEDDLLFARNKWLLSHPDANIAGSVAGIKGENLSVK